MGTRRLSRRRWIDPARRPPKLGKTTLAYDAIVAAATGKSFLGREVIKKKVLLLGLEEHRRDIVARLRK
jgi:RecA-family ATPase